MNRFLKKEWEDVEIPAGVYLKARSGAWSRVQDSRGFRRSSLIPAAVLAAAVVLVLVAVRFHGGGTLNRSRGVGGSTSPSANTTTLAPSTQLAVRLPSAKTAASPRQGRAQGSRIVTASPRHKGGAALRELRTANAAAQKEAPGGSNTSERLVMNFTLPESGVRVIWTLEKDFKIDGELR